MPAPTQIRAHTSRGVFELQWGDGTRFEVPFKLLRANCPCASCVDEHTGVRILDPATIPDDIAPTGMSFTGNYALKIVWNDRHSTGLYTWDHLAEIARCTKSS